MSLSRRQLLIGAAAAVVGACTTAARKGAQRGVTTTVPAVPAPDRSSPASAAPGASSGPARFVGAGPRATGAAGAAALTFHLGSGDPALTTQLLGMAARLRVQITVFAVGQWFEQHPEMARAILDGGHELSNHTYTHPSLGSVARAQVATEIKKCREVLVKQAGGPGAWFRPSGVEGTPSRLILEEAGAAGYDTVVGFDVDPKDYLDPGADAIASRVAQAIRAGSIVSLHLGHAGTVAAFERLVGSARAKGLTLVTVRDLLA